MVHRHGVGQQLDVDHIVDTFNPNRSEIAVVQHVKGSQHRMRLLVRDTPYRVYAGHADHAGVRTLQRIMNLPSTTARDESS
jgi:hypothetical protein